MDISSASDDDSAGRQLIDEATMGQQELDSLIAGAEEGIEPLIPESALPEPRRATAIQSANLLNAARFISPRLFSSPQSASSRTPARQSSLGADGREVGKPGKLKRPSFLAEDLNKVSKRREEDQGKRRRNVYDMLPPPAKMPPKESPTGGKAESKLRPIRAEVTGGKTKNRAEESPMSSTEQQPQEQTSGSEDTSAISSPSLGSRSGSERLHSDRLASVEVGFSDAHSERVPGHHYKAPPRGKRKADNLADHHEALQKSSPKKGKVDRLPDSNDQATTEAQPGRQTRSHLGRTEPQVVIPAKTHSTTQSSSEKKPTRSPKTKHSARQTIIEEANPAFVEPEQSSQQHRRPDKARAEPVKGNKQIPKDLSAEANDEGDGAPTTAGHQEELPGAKNRRQTTNSRPNNVKKRHIEDTPDDKRKQPTRLTRSKATVEPDVHNIQDEGEEVDTLFVSDVAPPEPKSTRSLTSGELKGRRKLTVRSKSSMGTTTEPEPHHALRYLNDYGNEVVEAGSSQPKPRRTPKPARPVKATTGDVVGDVDTLILGNDAECGEDQDGDEGNNANLDQTTGLERVFKFIEFGNRKGRCQTEAGRKIRRACRAACELFREDQVSQNDVEDTLGNIYAMVDTARRIKSADQQKELKTDAYAYLFRSLTLVLEALYDWTRDTFEHPVSTTVSELSLSALRLIVPFIKQILLFKDGITSWDVKISQRFKNDPITKDVHTELITPLRKLDVEYSRDLQALERAFEAQEIKRALLARQQQREAEEKRKAKAKELHDLRMLRWQTLHTVRMQCEPNVAEHKRLKCPNISDLEERDANGDLIERVDIFNHRTTPPRNRPSVDGRKWTDKQMTALVNGLRSYTGPTVFESLFRRYCRPGQPLREFTVTEITEQARSLKEMIITMDQMKGIETEEWVRKIPILP
ncbi:hypothetical protein K469DRAFT_745422 [Zopfia rhizophila CBS 207.26]|uniref:Uncharacterized protein n=1 Tax=Zopfia rhizophila CBS 207.26 TaxID=1314779 RepID=A0A6A6ELH1_9PEZI|nr:hypothetical protein K469DRAFT_745422 [Zopfia rhizophila CBS 207.26]